MRRPFPRILLMLATLAACGGREPPPGAPAGPPADAAAPATPAATGGAVDPASVERVTPEVARARTQSGQALLVCAYDDARCAQHALEGAITLSALQDRLAALPPDREIILYCD